LIFQGATKWSKKAAATQAAMAMIAPVRLFGKTPRLSIPRPARSAILTGIKAIVSPSPARARRPRQLVASFTS
jgi:hypothetical protein